MVTILIHRDGKTSRAGQVDPAWLDEGSGVIVWADIAAPTADDARLLRETFGFHELAIEDALGEMHHPKLEAYDGYLYVILHGIDFKASEHEFATHDVDFFVGPNYLVTVTDGRRGRFRKRRRSATGTRGRWREGPMALMHRIVDTMVDHYRPEVDKLEERIDDLEANVFDAGKRGRRTRRSST